MCGAAQPEFKVYKKNKIEIVAVCADCRGFNTHDAEMILYIFYKELIWDRCNKLKRTPVKDVCNRKEDTGGTRRVVIDYEE